jgi:hypothetical protein
MIDLIGNIAIILQTGMQCHGQESRHTDTAFPLLLILLTWSHPITMVLH